MGEQPGACVLVELRLLSYNGRRSTQDVTPIMAHRNLITPYRWMACQEGCLQQRRYHDGSI